MKDGAFKVCEQAKDIIEVRFTHVLVLKLVLQNVFATIACH